MTFAIGTLFLLLFIAMGIPVGFALGLAGVASMLMLIPISSLLALMTTVVHGTLTNFVMLTVPMFVLMAEFLGAGGVAEDLMLSCNRLLRKVHGGMAIAAVLAGAVLASASGSSTASAASITRAAYPAMRKAGYASSIAIGTIAVSGTLAIMIPPSVAFVLYGLMTDTSIGQLFLAGIIPGALTALGYVLTIVFMMKLKPELIDKAKQKMVLEQPESKGKVWPIVLLIVLVLGCLYSGIATPTEISALGAFGALIISYFSRRMNRKNFTTAIGNTLRTTAMILTIIFCAHLFGYFISFTKVTDSMLLWITNYGLSPAWVVMLTVLLYILLGMIMDQAAIIILTAPITAPLMVGLGYSPIWWGVIMIKTAEIGLVSPPMGLNVFVASAAAKADLRESFYGVMPFVVTELILLSILVSFPQLSLILAY